MPPFLKILLLTYITFLNIITQIDDDITRIIFYTIYISIIIILIKIKCKFAIKYKYTSLIISFISIIGLVHFLGFINNQISFQYLLFSIFYWSFSIIYFGVIYSNFRTKKVHKWIIYSLIFYVSINVVFFAFGIEGNYEAYGETKTDAQFLSILGINTTRTFFPLSTGINGFGILAGLSLIFCYTFLKENVDRKEKFCLYLGLILSCIALLKSDSRGGILFTTVTLSAITLVYNYKVLRRAIVFGSVFYSLILLLISILAVKLGAVDDLSRTSTLLSGREFIWLSSIDYLLNPDIHLLWGYGIFGQASAGVSSEYVSLFSGWNLESAEKVHLHSFFLQSIFDIGFIGTLLLLIYIDDLLEKIQTYKVMNYVVFSFILYGLFVGSTDLTFNIYRFEFLLLLISLSFFVRSFVSKPEPIRINFFK